MQLQHLKRYTSKKGLKGCWGWLKRNKKRLCNYKSMLNPKVLPKRRRKAFPQIGILQIERSHSSIQDPTLQIQCMMITITENPLRKNLMAMYSQPKIVRNQLILKVGKNQIWMLSEKSKMSVKSFVTSKRSNQMLIIKRDKNEIIYPLALWTHLHLRHNPNHTLTLWPPNNNLSL